MTKIIAIVGGAGGVGVTSVVNEIREYRPDFHLFRPLDLYLPLMFGISVEQEVIDGQIMEAFRSLPDGVTVVDWGRFVLPTVDGKWRLLLPEKRLYDLADNCGIEEIGISHIFASPFILQNRRRSAKAAHLSSWSLDYDRICREVAAENKAFNEMSDILCFRRPDHWLCLPRHVENIDLGEAARSIVYWIEIAEKVLSIYERRAA